MRHVYCRTPWIGFCSLACRRHREAGDFTSDGKLDIAGIDANNNMMLYTGNGVGLVGGAGSGSMYCTTGCWVNFRAIAWARMPGPGNRKPGITPTGCRPVGGQSITGRALQS